jgi:hypothetical protein
LEDRFKGRNLKIIGSVGVQVVAEGVSDPPISKRQQAQIPVVTSPGVLLVEEVVGAAVENVDESFL